MNWFKKLFRLSKNETTKVSQCCECTTDCGCGCLDYKRCDCRCDLHHNSEQAAWQEVIDVESRLEENSKHILDLKKRVVKLESS